MEASGEAPETTVEKKKHKKGIFGK